VQQQLKTTRTSLGLYGALLVLPTLVFGGLYWQELQQEYQAELGVIPEEAADGARRILTTWKDRLDKLVESESQRAFTEYGDYVHSENSIGDDINFQLSPMSSARTPEGILAWFSFDRRASGNSPSDVFIGVDTLGREGAVERFKPMVEEFRRQRANEHVLAPLTAPAEPRPIRLSAVAVHLGYKEYRDCLQECSPFMAGKVVQTSISNFTLHFYTDGEGKPRAIASRRIVSRGPLSELPEGAECLRSLVKGFSLQQGFLIDVNWLFRELPFEIAQQVLVEDEELRLPPQALPIDDVETVFKPIHPITDLGFETYRPEDDSYGRLEVVIDTDRIHARHETRSRKFLAVALMLVLTLACGMTLLYRSVNRELEQAHRTQNFVAAVTHELRTPLSTIRLHGEMLLDGWVTDEEKQQEYYRRIVRETGRLSTLVENVLEKSRLTENVTEPEAADLNQYVEGERSNLKNLQGSTDDLAFELAPNLPKAWLTPDGVTGIIANLVENARKYASVKPGIEPILIRTRYDGEHVLLEVADRGPGVPDSERDKIFQAFYRVGSEATRTTTGTGLGLHLVSLHAQVAGADVTVHRREGGGSIFRVAYRAAV
jgi:signal transduction histidine kinase